ncbi:Late embryogenesis abundant protein [Trema orientale]|uniref:Late embryogenesis abundant protein n=1 Tax=Trema orientale TaxID=63057 RepID=A0A2P5ES22_TREOI|nr:Late embryogenesis abundant protein [Trema orientale]
MAGSLSKSKLLTGKALSLSSITRRGYAAASQGSVGAGLSRGGSMSSMVGKVEERAVNVMKGESEAAAAASAWAPDPLTGYYRPANHAVEIDPVELRQMLLNNKARPLYNIYYILYVSLSRRSKGLCTTLGHIYLYVLL